MGTTVEKMLKEIFKDFEINSDIINTKIETINLYKKTNKLQVNLLSEKQIKVKDVNAFEKYLIKRFMLSKAVVHINYIKEIEGDFLKQWDDILDYLSYKHPLSKALLKDSNVQIEKNTINIKLKLPGANMLTATGIDTLLSDLIFNVFGKKYKVIYIDNNSEESKKQIQEYTKNIQTEVIKKFQAESIVKEERQENLENKDVKEEEKQISNKITEKEEIKQEPEEITPLILGRNQNIKEQLVKVVDISIDSGKISLEGEVINSDSRELKSGKFLFMFDLYDGTSTITCKAFIEKEKFKEVSRQDKICKGD